MIFFWKKKRNAYGEGYLAAEDVFARSGRSSNPVCPYRPRTEEYDDWIDGFDDASRECCHRNNREVQDSATVGTKQDARSQR